MFSSDLNSCMMDLYEEKRENINSYNEKSFKNKI